MMTPEREREIRGRRLQMEGESHTYPDPDIQELFAELDRVRAENTILTLSNDEVGYAQEARVYKNQCDQLREKIVSLFELIKHGDEKHQAWLKEIIENHFDMAKIRADFTNPNEPKYVAWPSSLYMSKAREALAKIKGKK